jgi:hypothetical protein
LRKCSGVVEMMWAIASLFFVGLALGHIYRVPTLLLASALAAAGMLGFEITTEGLTVLSLIYAVGGAASLQTGYLLGLVLRFFFARAFPIHVETDRSL